MTQDMPEQQREELVAEPLVAHYMISIGETARELGLSLTVAELDQAARDAVIRIHGTAQA